MMVFTRYNGNVLPFAVNATGTNRTVFGDVVQSDDINDNLNADFKLGWEIVGVNDNPTKQDFNALAYTISNLVSYLYQQGVAEWNSLQNYIANSYVTGSDGKIYQALTGDATTPNVGNDPTTDTVNWRSLDDLFAYKQGDNTTTFKVADAVNGDEALSKGQLLAEIKAVDGVGSGLDADLVQGVTKDLLGIGGDGYAWVDETANRAAGTTYTNTTGKPIFVSIRCGNNTVITLTVNSKVISRIDESSATTLTRTISGIVPNNSTYLISSSDIYAWHELK